MEVYGNSFHFYFFQNDFFLSKIININNNYLKDYNFEKVDKYMTLYSAKYQYCKSLILLTF